MFRCPQQPPGVGAEDNARVSEAISRALEDGYRRCVTRRYRHEPGSLRPRDEFSEIWSARPRLMVGGVSAPQGQWIYELPGSARWRRNVSYSTVDWVSRVEALGTTRFSTTIQDIRFKCAAPSSWIEAIFERGAGPPRETLFRQDISCERCIGSDSRVYVAKCRLEAARDLERGGCSTGGRRCTRCAMLVRDSGDVRGIGRCGLWQRHLQNQRGDCAPWLYPRRVSGDARGG